MASWLVRSTPKRAVRVRPLAGVIVLCSWARHFTLTVPHSTQVYKWVLANFWGNLTKLQGSDLRWTSIPPRGSRNTSAASCYRNQDKLQQLWARLGSKASLFLFIYFMLVCENHVLNLLHPNTYQKMAEHFSIVGET